MNPVKKLMSWWRGPTDPETLASMAETRGVLARRQTIRVSQNTAAKGAGSSLLNAPTPDLLDPGNEEPRRSLRLGTAGSLAEQGRSCDTAIPLQKATGGRVDRRRQRRARRRSSCDLKGITV